MRLVTRFPGSLGKYLLLGFLACLPLVGQIILTILILQESRSRASALLWILAVWLMPYLGPFAYVLLGRPELSGRQAFTILLALAVLALVGLLLFAGLAPHGS